jgi:hypothetical protein
MASPTPEHEGRIEKTSIDMLFRTIGVILNFSILIPKRGMLAICFLHNLNLYLFQPRTLPSIAASNSHSHKNGDIKQINHMRQYY